MPTSNNTNHQIHSEDEARSLNFNLLEKARALKGEIGSDLNEAERYALYTHPVVKLPLRLNEGFINCATGFGLESDTSQVFRTLMQSEQGQKLLGLKCKEPADVFIKLCSASEFCAEFIENAEYSLQEMGFKAIVANDPDTLNMELERIEALNEDLLAKQSVVIMAEVDGQPAGFAVVTYELQLGDNCEVPMQLTEKNGKVGLPYFLHFDLELISVHSEFKKQGVEQSLALALVQMLTNYTDDCFSTFVQYRAQLDILVQGNATRKRGVKTLRFLQAMLDIISVQQQALNESEMELDDEVYVWANFTRND